MPEEQLKWKLIPGTVYLYDYSQKTLITASGEAGRELPSGAGEMGMSGEGGVTVACGEAGARVYVDMGLTEVTTGGRTVGERLASLMPRIRYELSMDADGVVTAEPGAEEKPFQMNMFFPLPRLPLGGSAPLEEELSISVSNLATLSGTAVYTFKGEYMEGGARRVGYAVKLGVSTPDGGGPVRASMDGHYDCVFAPDAGHFISSEGGMKLVIEVPEPSGAVKGMSMESSAAVRFASPER